MCDWTSQGIPVRRPSNRTVSEHMDAFAAHEDDSYGVICEDLKIAWEITDGMATAKRSERKGVGHWVDRFLGSLNESRCISDTF